MIPRFTKGAPLAANDLNALADAACMNIIGGTGVAVTRLGKKLVVNKRLGQTLQKGQSTRGHIYKLNKNLRFKWAWAGASGTKACFDVAANGSRIYGLIKSAVEEPNIVYTIVGVSTSGTSLWSTARASDDVRAWGQILDVPDVGVMIPQHSLILTPAAYRYDFQQRDESGTQVWNLNVGGFPSGDIWYAYRRTDGCAFDGTNYFTIATMPNTAPAAYDANLINFDSDGTVISTVDISAGLPASGSWYCERLAYYNGYLYFAGRRGVSGGDFTHFVKFDTSGTISWKFNAGDFGSPALFDVSRFGQVFGNIGQDICVTTDEDVYCVGLRSNSWTGATGYASLWKFNSAGTLQWTWDSGSDLMCCAADDDGNVYVGGYRSDTWPGGAVYKNVWKLDTDGNVLDSFDTGSYSDAEEVSIVRALRIYLSGVFVGCTWDGVAA